MKFQKTKNFLLIALIIFPTSLILSGFLVQNVAAGPDIPVRPDPTNNWHWGVDVGDNYTHLQEYMVEEEDGTVKEGKAIVTTNITNIANTTEDFQEFSYLQGEYIYYNVSQDKIVPLQDSAHNITKFGWNSTLSEEYRGLLSFGENKLIPEILPLNSTTFDASNMFDIINLTYNRYAEFGVLPYFNTGSYEQENNKIWLRNETHGYYLNLTYFDNGSLSQAKYFIHLDTGDVMNITATITHLPSWNMTRNTDWSVEVEDKIYYGNHENEGNSQKLDEVEVKITKMNKTNVIAHALGGNQIPQVFEAVFANYSIWNWTTREYDFVEYENLLMGLGNDYVPIDLYNLMGMGDRPENFILPMNTAKENIAGVFSNSTANSMGFDFVYISDNGASLNFVNESSVDLEIKFDKESGKMRKFRQFNSTDTLSVIFWKNNTKITGNVNKQRLWGERTDNVKMFLNTTVNTGDAELYWSLFDYNPTFTPLANEIENMPIYVDLYTNVTYPTVEWFNFTIEYDEALLNDAGISEDSLMLFGFDNSSKTWGKAEKDLVEVNTEKNEIYGYLNTSLISGSYPIWFFSVGFDLAKGIDWDVEIGDEYYASGDSVYRYKISHFNTTTVNMTEIGLPTDGFKIQDFSNVWAIVSEWVQTGESTGYWDILGESLFGAANEYWYLAPFQYIDQYSPNNIGPAMLLPSGTNGTDLSNNLNPHLATLAMESINEVEENHVQLINGSHYIDVNFNSTTGLVKLIEGSFYQMGEWMDFSFYTLNNHSINGQGSIQIDTEFSSSDVLSMSLDYEVTNQYGIYSRALDLNPTNESLPTGTPLVYFDILWKNETHGFIRFNLTVELANSLDIDKLNISFYYFEPQSHQWMIMPQDDLERSLTIDPQTNTLVLNSTIVGAQHTISAISYVTISIEEEGDDEDQDQADEGGEEEDLEIPGYNLAILISALMVLSVAIYYKKQKIDLK